MRITGAIISLTYFASLPCSYSQNGDPDRNQIQQQISNSCNEVSLAIELFERLIVENAERTPTPESNKPWDLKTCIATLDRLLSRPTTATENHALLTATAAYEKKGETAKALRYASQLVDQSTNTTLATLAMLTAARIAAQYVTDTDPDRDSRLTNAENYIAQVATSLKNSTRPTDVLESQWSDQQRGYNSMLHVVSSSMALARKNFSLAAAELNAAIALTKRPSAEAILHLGSLYEAGGKYDESVTALNRLLFDSTCSPVGKSDCRNDPVRRKAEALKARSLLKASPEVRTADHLAMGEEAWRTRFYDTAIKHLSLAAQSGDITAQYDLGTIYSGEEHPEYYARQGLDISGLHSPLDLTKAKFWLGKAAENTSGEREIVLKAQFALAGLLTRQKSYREAAIWLKKAAGGGSVEALSNLGLIYQQGLGVERNYTEAVKYFKAADEAGSRTAAYHLGVAYYDGRGVTKDYDSATRWLTKSARHGDPLAMQFLGLIAIEDGNKTEAYKWFALAAERDRDAIPRRDAIARQLGPTELNEARVALQEWKRQ